jgi:hypothetical protein
MKIEEESLGALEHSIPYNTIIFLTLSNLLLFKKNGITRKGGRSQTMWEGDVALVVLEADRRFDGKLHENEVSPRFLFPDSSPKVPFFVVLFQEVLFP